MNLRVMLCGILVAKKKNTQCAQGVREDSEMIERGDYGLLHTIHKKEYSCY